MNSDKSLENNTQVKVLKKRGRKPKSEKTKQTPPQEKKNKKRGRKPKTKTYSISNNVVNDIDSENIILHLPINTKKIVKSSKEDELLTYNPELNNPIGWQSNKLAGNSIDSVAFIDNTDKIENYSCYPFDKKEEILSALIDDDDELNNDSQLSYDIINDNKINNIEIKHNKNWYNNDEPPSVSNYNEIITNIKEKRKKDVDNYSSKSTNCNIQSTLIQFKESNKTKSWPNSTSIYCWWCCHPFEGSPCSLPYEYKDETFHVYGVFCSPECSASYNFDNNDGINIWERYSLLNLLYRTVYNDKNIKIKLAPPRQTLRIFGGSLQINEFRFNNTNYNHTYYIIKPPMISIIPQQEFSFSNDGFNSKLGKKYITIDKNKINSELTLKRNNPFMSSNNPLEKCMNLSIVS